ncbi:MAG: hypothetical protein CMP31_14220 [Roseibacillus sp.]|nr:hypothetical protein [Roseibacillus sp.]
MGDISEVPGITDSVLLLLREAELDTVELLISLEIEEILLRLDQAGRRLAVTGPGPSANLVKAWQNTGRNLLRKQALVPAPEAKEVSLDSLQGAGIDLASVPVAKVVEDSPPGDRPVEVVRKIGLAGREHPREFSSRDSATMESEEPEVAFQTLEDRRDVSSRGERRNRGMSHPDAGLVRWAALVTVGVMLLAILAILGLVTIGVMVLVFQIRFHWSITFLFLVFPFCLILYLTQAAKARCRLCGQKLFVPKKCRKHVRAGRSILGHTFAMARNAVIFANYHCMFCGTKTRLKD